jgi:hypothetical protein
MIPWQVDDLDPDLGVLGVEGPKDGCRQLAGSVQEDADSEAARRGLRPLRSRAREHGLGVADHAGRVLVEERARHGQLHFVRIPLEEIDPDLLLEPPDGRAQALLREEQALRRPAEVEFLRNCQEVSKLRQVHRSLRWGHLMPQGSRQQHAVVSVAAVRGYGRDHPRPVEFVSVAAPGVNVLMTDVRASRLRRRPGGGTLPVRRTSRTTSCA